MKRSSSVSGIPSLTGRPSIGGAMRVKTDTTGRPSLVSTGGASASKFGGSHSNLFEGSGGRPSGARASLLPSTCKQRRTNVYGFSANEMTKDPRPIGDKTYREKCIRSIIEFLTLHGYPAQISLKQLSSPSASDFRKIFEYLMNFIWPNYKIAEKKIDEEVPRVLKLIGYPFTIQKSYLTTVGAQHTWPTILAALTWLKNVIEIKDANSIEEMLFPRFPPDSEQARSITEQRILHDFCVTTYGQFLGGADVFDDAKQKLERTLVGDTDIDDEIKDLERKFALNEVTLSGLLNQPNELAALQDQLPAVIRDRDQLRLYRDKCEHHFHQLQLGLHQLEESERVIAAEFAAKSADLASKEELLAEQNRMGVDIQGLALERASVLRRLATVEKELEEIDCEVFNTEKILMKEKEEIEKFIGDYTKAMQTLQLVPAGAANAGGLDLALSPDFTADDSNHYSSVVRPALLRIKQQYLDHCRTLEGTARQEAEARSQIDELIVDMNEQMKGVQANIARLDEQIANKKEAHQRASEQIQQHIAAKRAELDSFEVASVGAEFKNVEEAEQAVRQIEQELEERRKFHKKEKADVLQLMREGREEATSYKQEVMEAFRRHINDYSALVEAAMSADSARRQELAEHEFDDIFGPAGNFAATEQPTSSDKASS